MLLMSKRGGPLLLVVLAAACGGKNSGSNNTVITGPPPPTTTLFSLSGQVTESGTTTGVSGAVVLIADGVNGGRAATTDTSGNYSFTSVTQSTFTLNASASGYATQNKAVNLTANQTVSFQLVRSGPRTQFGTGQWLVNSDIAAGRYYSDPTSGCYWERQSGLGGTLEEIIANEFIFFNAGQWIVDILSSDKAFKTQTECGTWFNTPRAGAQTSISPGMWLVGAQITPGTYRVTASAGCYWERLRDFQGTLSSIIANDFVSGGGTILVAISASDVGFHTDGDCGVWSRVSSVSPPILQSQDDIERARAMHRARR